MENQIMQMLLKMNTKLDKLESQNLHMTNLILEQDKSLTNLYQLLALLLEETNQDEENPLLETLEKIGEDIGEVISLATGSEDVIVHITSSHSCMSARGIKSTDSKTATLATKGVFNEDNMIHRFMLMKQS